MAEKINIHNDEEMISNGLLRCRKYVGRISSLWTHTNHEKKVLKDVKHQYKAVEGHFNNVPKKRGTLRDTLIVQLKRNKSFPKTTYSYNCLNTEIGDIISKFCDKSNNTLVSKYYFNGKTYIPS